MSLSFNNPLYIGDKDAAVKSDIAELQSDVGDLSQLETGDKSSLVNALNEAMDSTLNGVNRDLTNLSTVGTQKLRSLNAYANEGELLTDAEGLADVKNYAHSTFDASKFTKVGSPVVTEDGIASGFSTSNYLKITNLSSYWTATALWSIKFSFTPNVLPVASTTKAFIGLNNYNYILLGTNASSVTFFNFNFNDRNIIVSDINIGNKYDFEFGWNGTQLYLNYSINGVVQTSKYTNLATSLARSIMEIGYDSQTGYSFGDSIDLKQFSITVDGVEVFSGNKTGIDTIKPDDYTVVGTPIISADGMITDFTSNDYIYKTIDVSSAKDYIEHEMEFTLPSGTYSDNRAVIDLGIGTASSLIYVFSNQSGLTFNGFGGNKSTTIILGKTYNVKVKIYSNGDYRVDWKNLTDNTNGYWTGINTYFTTAVTSGNITLYFGRSISNDYPFPYSDLKINLNKYKLYVDGNLVYQPCLKIPFTLSKTGAKIVDSIYRDRVTDMYEQFGYAPYYTLSDTDFTLPQVELYGLIGQRTLRDSYRNGINYWELYSNRDLEQGGSCTSGVEVTFARPFADTNYVLSVPYSAKSATAFTPTQTGDWIAKGKGIL